MVIVVHMGSGSPEGQSLLFLREPQDLAAGKNPQMISFNFLISQVRKLNSWELKDLFRFKGLVNGRVRTEFFHPLIFPSYQADLDNLLLLPK